MCFVKSAPPLVQPGLSEDELGGSEEVHQRFDQQSQRVQHRQHHPGAAAGEHHQGQVSGSERTGKPTFSELISCLVNTVSSRPSVRGLLSRSVLQAQAASPIFTHVYAAVVAIINSKFPQIGELILKRLILAFRRSYRRNLKVPDRLDMSAQSQKRQKIGINLCIFLFVQQLMQTTLP